MNDETSTSPETPPQEPTPEAAPEVPSRRPLTPPPPYPGEDPNDPYAGICPPLPPGKRVTSGRRHAVAIVDRILQNPHNQRRLYDVMQEKFEADPEKFLIEHARPLTPASMLSDKEGDDESKSPEGLAKAMREALGGMLGATLQVPAQEIRLEPQGALPASQNDSPVGTNPPSTTATPETDSPKV